MSLSSSDAWASGDAYEPYIGRWSRLVAREFLAWLAVGPAARWLDVGCGTGALTETILATVAPARVDAVDSSADYVSYARRRVSDMQLIRHFWNAAIALDPGAVELDEARRFPICRPEPLESLFRSAELRDVESRPIDAPTRFQDFDDYWRPFLGGQGPAPGYAMRLSEEHRAALREQIRAQLPIERDGSINLIARAWAVRGTRI